MPPSALGSLKQDFDASDAKTADAIVGGVPVGGDFGIGRSQGTVGSQRTAQSQRGKTPGSNLEGVADLINQAADESIARLGKGREREQQQLLQGFTERGLRRSGLASGAAADLSQQALQEQRSIERQRLGELAKLGEEAIRARSRERARRASGGGGIRRSDARGQEVGSIFGATQSFEGDGGQQQQQPQQQQQGKDALGALQFGIAPDGGSGGAAEQEKAAQQESSDAFSQGIDEAASAAAGVTGGLGAGLGAGVGGFDLGGGGGQRQQGQQDEEVSGLDTAFGGSGETNQQSDTSSDDELDVQFGF